MWVKSLAPFCFVLSRVFKVHNINLIQLYAWIAETKYYIYSGAQNYKNKQKFLSLAAFAPFFALFILTYS
jgi:hypothetical protein